MKYLLQMAFLLILSTKTIAQAEVQTQEVEYTQNGTILKGYLAYDSSTMGKRPGILVVHEWWGHNKHARERAHMLAKIGYTALAIDMYGDGKLANHPKKAGEYMIAAFNDWDTSKARFKKAKEFLQSHKTVDIERIGAIGFCFGGEVSLRIIRGGADLDGVVAFHSALPLEPTIKNIKASVLIINGSQDGFLKPETIGTFSRQMAESNADFTYISMAGVKHSYTNKQADEFSRKFNIPALEFNNQADERAWSAMQKFFKRVFDQ
jgi:dienelactone hydrolase